MIDSPYKNHPEEKWLEITKQLIAEFPLSKEDIVKVVSDSWNDLYTSTIGSSGLVIGKNIFLPAQATGVILERIIGSALQRLDSKIWVGGKEKIHKDIVNLKNDRFSFEIKTSSSANGVYGNRSTGYRSDNSKKIRSGYYLVINYQLPTETLPEKKIRKIRFGWIDDDDWVGQKESSGQQASISSHLAKLKLISLLDN
ncbi:MAG: ScaI family restriction endonuclease [Alphaproteobacteria bacterium]